MNEQELRSEFFAKTGRVATSESVEYQAFLWGFTAAAASRDAEVAELKADAQRYRWLRDNKAANNTHCWHFQTGPIIPGLLTLDASIDAVLAKVRKP